MTLVTYYVEVLLNETEDDEGRLAIFSRFGDEPRYQEGDDLHLAWSGSVTINEDAESVLDKAYEMFNRGAPYFVGDDAYPHRSLSVGDVLRLDETERWVCERVGWEKIGV